MEHPYASTVFDDLASALLRLVARPPALAGGQIVDDTLDDVMPEDVNERISVLVGAGLGSLVQLSGAPREWTTEVFVRIRARADHRQIDRLTAQRTTRSMGIAHQFIERLMEDPTLGGIAQFVDVVRVIPDHQVADSSLGVVTVVCSARLFTPYNGLRAIQA